MENRPQTRVCLRTLRLQISALQWRRRSICTAIYNYDCFAARTGLRTPVQSRPERPEGELLGHTAELAYIRWDPANIERLASIAQDKTVRCLSCLPVHALKLRACCPAQLLPLPFWSAVHNSCI